MRFLCAASQGCTREVRAFAADSCALICLPWRSAWLLATGSHRCHPFATSFSKAARIYVTAVYIFCTYGLRDSTLRVSAAKNSII